MAIDRILLGGWNGWSDRHTRRFAPLIGHWTETVGVNQDGAEVMSFERTMLVHRRGHSPEEAAGY